jgi:hypothetical protein
MILTILAWGTPGRQRSISYIFSDQEASGDVQLRQIKVRNIFGSKFIKNWSDFGYFRVPLADVGVK